MNIDKLRELSALSAKGLRPCPFCGGEAYTADEWPAGELPHVWCLSCLAMTREYLSCSDAINAWNRRAHESELLEMAKSLTEHKALLLEALDKWEDWIPTGFNGTDRERIAEIRRMVEGRL